MRCNLGCTFLYNTNTITFLGVYFNSGTSTQYTGIFQFNPDSSFPGSSILKLSYSSYDFLYPVMCATGDTRFLIGAYSSVGGTSLVMGMPDNLSIIDHIASFLGNTKVKKIGIVLSPFKRAFAYLEDLGIPNQFFIVRYVLDSASPIAELNFRYQSPSNTRITFLDMVAITSYTTYIMVYFVTTKQVVLFDTY
jgi:hypothetical protein